MLAIDHVIVPVENLDAAARRYYDQWGLASVSGGRHPGHGTANRIVPLGSSYIELMAVVDRVEADSSPLGSWVGRRLRDGGDRPRCCACAPTTSRAWPYGPDASPSRCIAPVPTPFGSNGASWPWTLR